MATLYTYLCFVREKRSERFYSAINGGSIGLLVIELTSRKFGIKVGVKPINSLEDAKKYDGRTGLVECLFPLKGIYPGKIKSDGEFAGFDMDGGSHLVLWYGPGKRNHAIAYVFI